MQPTYAIILDFIVDPLLFCDLPCVPCSSTPLLAFNLWLHIPSRCQTYCRRTAIHTNSNPLFLALLWAFPWTTLQPPRDYLTKCVSEWYILSISKLSVHKHEHRAPPSPAKKASPKAVFNRRKSTCSILLLVRAALSSIALFLAIWASNLLCSFVNTSWQSWSFDSAASSSFCASWSLTSAIRRASSFGFTTWRWTFVEGKRQTNLSRNIFRRSFISSFVASVVANVVAKLCLSHRKSGWFSNSLRENP